MGRFEVTAGQYCEFLNAVAAADTYGLYNPVMALTDPPGYADNSCRILRSGTPGSYTYSVAADWANRPVNYVSWGDAARFANWLTNGQLTGAQGPSTTEDGSYYLNGAVTNEALLGVTRKPNARYVIPTEDEWYKAAYHKNDGATGNYWVYTTATDTLPSNVLGDPTDPGNNATFLCTDPYTLTIGGPYYRTEVGAHEHSESPYGTFDQGGNVYEWNETLIGDSYPLSHRGLRGGSYIDLADYSLPATCRSGGEPTLEGKAFGFRIAEVPEPASLWLLALAAFGLAQWRRGS